MASLPMPVPFSLWFVVAGVVLTRMAMAATILDRMPLSSAQLYLLVGVAIGPAGIGLLDVDPLAEASALERITEVAVILSLFAAGLKLRTPLTDGRWKLPIRLAVVSMALTVGLVAVLGVWGLGLSLGAAVLLGGILAPIDPVLAGDEAAATHDKEAPAVMAQTVLTFTEQLDRIGAVAVVVLTGALVHLAEWSWAAAAFVAVLFLVVRPVAVWVGLAGSASSGVQRGLTAWFGVRGIGSLYYLFYAAVHGVEGPLAERLLGLVLTVVVASAVLHGVSVTPLMAWYQKRAGREERVARAV